MKTITIALAAAAASLAVPAVAQRGPRPDPYGDTTVSRAEAAKVAADRFAQLDTNHDGSLTPEERAAGDPGGGRGPRGAAAGPQTKDEYVAAQLARFDRMDTDHDGSLTKSERNAFREAMRARFQQGGGAPGGQ